MAGPEAKLVELVAKWPHDLPQNTQDDARFNHLEFCRRCQIEALLAAPQEQAGTFDAETFANENYFMKPENGAVELTRAAYAAGQAAAPAGVCTVKPWHPVAASGAQPGTIGGTMHQLQKEIATSINRVSAENGSNTPDFILAEFLTDCLAAWDKASRAREKWYGKSLSIGGSEVPAPVPGPQSNTGGSIALLSKARITEDSTWRGGWRWTCKHGNESALHYTKLECGCELIVQTGGK